MPKRVLIIEDDPSLGQTMLEMLEMLGFHPKLSSGFRIAQAILEDDRNWDAIISDFSLGDGKGSDIMRFCLGDPELKDCVQIITSGYERAAQQAVLEGLDNVHWLVKPYPIAKLVELIK